MMMVTAARRFVLGAVLALLSGLFSGQTLAQDSPAKPMSQEEIQKELAESWEKASKVARLGPQAVALGAQGSLQVPNEIAFIPMPEAGGILRALGNTVSPNLLGLVTSVDDSEEWFATVSYIPEGYIRDDDAKEWDADELLNNLRTGAERDNKDRKARGFPELEILGWIERPTYTSADHKLVWSASLKDKGAPAEAAGSVNYNTYVLGREGYFSLNFVTSSGMIEAQKPIARTLLAGLQFVPGKRYEDFNPSTDKVAAYGLAALVGGAALKKAGFFAIVAALAAKFWKIGLVLVIALFGGAMKLLRRQSSGRA